MRMRRLWIRLFRAAIPLGALPFLSNCAGEEEPKPFPSPPNSDSPAPTSRLKTKDDKALSSVKERFTAAQRASIAKELEAAEAKAQKEADRRIPVSIGMRSDQAEKNAALLISLEEKYHQQICKRHHISDDDMTAIIGEAMANRMK